MFRLKDPEKAQETKDAVSISTWKSSLKGYNRATCSKELCDYLDENMPGWRLDRHKSKPRSAKGWERMAISASEKEKIRKTTNEMMPIAKDIITRFLANGKQYPSLKLKCRQDPTRCQEYEDALKLHDWDMHVAEEHAPTVFKLLDRHMPNWRLDDIAVQHNKKDTLLTKARQIIKRCDARYGELPRLIPVHEQRTPQLILENKDAMKLSDWKVSYIENPKGFSSELMEFLNTRLPDWLDIKIAISSMRRHSDDFGRRKRQTVGDNGTDEEVISYHSTCTFRSDRSTTSEGDGSESSGTSISPCCYSQSADSDDNACVAALLKLGSESRLPSGRSVRPPQKHCSISTADAAVKFKSTMDNKPLVVSHFEHTVRPFYLGGTGSTYGNGCRTQHRLSDRQTCLVGVTRDNLYNML